MPNSSSSSHAGLSRLVLSNLSVSLGGQRVLTGLTADVKARAVGLLGPNGAGKSTVIRTLLGWHRPDTGSAALTGATGCAGEGIRRERIGYMPEQDAFIAEMTAVHLVRYMAELSGLPPHAALERAHEALFFVGLGEARYRAVGGFSTGMKQLVKLAQAIVHAPQVIILDEPTNGLDPTGRARMLDLIRQIRDSGEAMILLSSHLLPDVESVCEQVLILDRGQIAGHCDLVAERAAPTDYLEVELLHPCCEFFDRLTGLGCRLENRAGERRLVTLPPSVGMTEVVSTADEVGAVFRVLERSRDSLHEMFLRVLGGDDGGP